MPKKHCKVCFYSVIDCEGDFTGECRKNAPIPYIKPLASDFEALRIFPEVDLEHDWCGDWSPKHD